MGNLGKSGGDIFMWRPPRGFRILASRVCQRIQYTEYAQLQVAIYKTVCSCMYSYFIAITNNLLSPSVVLLYCSST